MADLSNYRVYNIIEGKFPAMVEKTLMSYRNREKSDYGVHGLKLRLQNHR